MRIRTALVEIKRAVGLVSFFNQAVERRLAWVIGTGRVYADLQNVSRKFGYEIWVNESKSDDIGDYWVAVRADLIKNTFESGPLQVHFETNVEGLGVVNLGFGLDDEAEGLQFFINEEKELAFHSEDDRVYEIPKDLKDTDDFDYTEVLYLVEPLES